MNGYLLFREQESKKPGLEPPNTDGRAMRRGFIHWYRPESKWAGLDLPGTDGKVGFVLSWKNFIMMQ